MGLDQIVIGKAARLQATSSGWFFDDDWAPVQHGGMGLVESD